MFGKNRIIQISVLLSLLFILAHTGFGGAQKRDEGWIGLAGDTTTKGKVIFWLTEGDQKVLFEKQNSPLLSGLSNGEGPNIVVDTSKKFQTMDGFGYCLTGGSAYLIHRLPEDQRRALLRELFSTDNEGIGVSYLRVSIGASDLSRTVFSYDDVPQGQTDIPLAHFNLAADTLDLIPLLKEIIAIDPHIKILGSPWSPPVWMKTNQSSIGGRLKPEFYDAYARYFVKYIQAMKFQGIRIDAITPQNEPLNPKNNPSLDMQAEAQRDFVRNNLGPAFRKVGLDTKIILYDHNCDRPDYPLTILDDPEARKYVDGSAFHLYGGDVSALTTVHDAYPDKNVYFTEQWTGGPGQFAADLNWHVKTLIIGATRNWSKNVLEWNLASDPHYQPHTPGGCTTCMGALTIGDSIKRNVSYYIIAHAAKFVRPGSVRIESNILKGLPNVAFKTPNGETVLIVLNDSDHRKEFNIHLGDNKISVVLNGGAVGTYLLP